MVNKYAHACQKESKPFLFFGCGIISLKWCLDWNKEKEEIEKKWECSSVNVSVTVF